MRELKSFRIKEVEDGCPFWQAEYEVYSKSKVDKLIAEKDLEIKKLEYKRCLVMAEKCKESMRLMRTYEATDDYWIPEPGHDAEYFCKRGDFYKKWHKRWLELAEQFKRAK